MRYMWEMKKSDESLAAAFYKRRDDWIDHVLEKTDIHQTTRLIGIWIARRINAETKDTWYQTSTIAARTGVSVRTVLRSIQELEGKDLIVVRRDGRRGVKKAVNRYEFVPVSGESDMNVTSWK